MLFDYNLYKHTHAIFTELSTLLKEMEVYMHSKAYTEAFVATKKCFTMWMVRMCTQDAGLGNGSLQSQHLGY